MVDLNRVCTLAFPNLDDDLPFSTSAPSLRPPPARQRVDTDDEVGLAYLTRVRPPPSRAASMQARVGSNPTKNTRRASVLLMWTLVAVCGQWRPLARAVTNTKQGFTESISPYSTIYTYSHTPTMSLLRTSVSRAISRSTMFNSVRTYAAGPGGSDAGHTASSTGFREREQVSERIIVVGDAWKGCIN